MIWRNVRIEKTNEKCYGRVLAAPLEGTLDLMMTEHPSFLKMSIVCDILQCSPLKANRSFEGIYRLHLQGRKISQIRKHNEACSKLYSGFFDLEMVAIYSSETSVDFQRSTRRYIAEFFITIVVRTSNPR
jgi:hypothetical protein